MCSNIILVHSSLSKPFAFAILTLPLRSRSIKAQITWAGPGPPGPCVQVIYTSLCNSLPPSFPTSFPVFPPYLSLINLPFFFLSFSPSPSIPCSASPPPTRAWKFVFKRYSWGRVWSGGAWHRGSGAGYERGGRPYIRGSPAISPRYWPEWVYCCSSVNSRRLMLADDICSWTSHPLTVGNLSGFERLYLYPYLFLTRKQKEISWDWYPVSRTF